MAPCGEKQFDPAQLFPYRPETLRLLRLAMESVELPLDLTDYITDTEQILLCGLHLFEGNLLAGLVFCDTGGLFDQKTALLRLCHQDHADTPLLDNRISPGADTGIHEKFSDIHQPTGGSVEEVIAFTITVKPARYLNF